MSTRNDDTDQAQEIAELRAKLAAADRKIAALTACANEDPLLGILNRRGFLAEIDRAISFAARYRVPVSLLYGDVDGFKVVNDRYGHDVGDQVLQHVAMVIESNIRGSDRIGRIGGDELAILLWYTDHEIGVWKARVLTALLSKTPYERAGLCVPVQVSFGVTQLDDNDISRNALARADRAMYAAKDMVRSVQAVEMR